MFKSYQSGIETGMLNGRIKEALGRLNLTKVELKLRLRVCSIRFVLRLNLTKVELKHIREWRHFLKLRTFKSYQSGIETSWWLMT